MVIWYLNLVKSVQPDSWSMENVVADLLAVVDAAIPGMRFVASGLSFGGLASLHFMLRHPERVAALALFGSGPGFKNREAAEGWAAQVERTARFLEERGFAQAQGASHVQGFFSSRI